MPKNPFLAGWSPPRPCRLARSCNSNTGTIARFNLCARPCIPKIDQRADSLSLVAPLSKPTPAPIAAPRPALPLIAPINAPVAPPLTKPPPAVLAGARRPSMNSEQVPPLAGSSPESRRLHQHTLIEGLAPAVFMTLSGTPTHSPAP